MQREHEKPERRITDGGRELRVYVDEIGQSVPDFCAEHDIERITCQRVMNGERWQQISVDFATDIERATRGRIRPASFRSETARPPKRARTAPPPAKSSSNVSARVRKAG